jgi:hypothetical protein
MSTHSAIIFKTSGGYKGIYCYSDGYLEEVGKTLYTHYSDPALVEKLVNLGDLSSLGEKIDAGGGMHSFNQPCFGVTVAYHRDRGEPWNSVSPKTGNTAERVVDLLGGYFDWIYIFEDESWTVNGKPLGKELAEAGLITLPPERSDIHDIIGYDESLLRRDGI